MVYPRWRVWHESVPAIGFTSRLQRQPGSNVPFMKVAAPALPTTAWPCALNGLFSPSRARLLMNACVMPPPLPVARAPDASGRGDPSTGGWHRLVDERDGLRRVPVR